VQIVKATLHAAADHFRTPKQGGGGETLNLETTLQLSVAEQLSDAVSRWCDVTGVPATANCHPHSLLQFTFVSHIKNDSSVHC